MAGSRALHVRGAGLGERLRHLLPFLVDRVGGRGRGQERPIEVEENGARRGRRFGREHLRLDERLDDDDLLVGERPLLGQVGRHRDPHEERWRADLVLLRQACERVGLRRELRSLTQHRHALLDHHLLGARDVLLEGFRLLGERGAVLLLVRLRPPLVLGFLLAARRVDPILELALGREVTERWVLSTDALDHRTTAERVLLLHVAELVGEDAPAGIRVRLVLVGAEHDVATGGERAGADRRRRSRRLVAGVDAHIAEIAAEA